MDKVSDGANDLVFELHDPFALTHFDLRYYDKPSGHLQDTRTAEDIVQRAKFCLRDAWGNDEGRKSARQLLKSSATICARAQNTVLEQALLIDALYRSSTVVDGLPHIPATRCCLRWPEPRIQELVRALVAVDIANRQLNHLLFHAVIDFKFFKKQQFRLIRPLRSALSAIYTLASKLPRQVKEPARSEDGQLLPSTAAHQKIRPTWIMASKDVVDRLNRRKISEGHSTSARTESHPDASGTDSMVNRPDQELTDATCRVAFAVYLRAVGELAHRAGAFASDSRFDELARHYAPFRSAGHAASTALAFDHIGEHLPQYLSEKAYPFAKVASAERSGGVESADDCLQTMIAIANELAGGMEFDQSFASYEMHAGDDFVTQRLLTSFEQMHSAESKRADAANLFWRYPLLPLSADSIFPRPAAEIETADNNRAAAEYKALWDRFVLELEKIRPAHRHNLSLWLDHFDSLWMVYAHAIPLITESHLSADIPLFDHSRVTAALTAALWRWHEDRINSDPLAVSRLQQRLDFNKSKFLLVQGDFFGVQTFLFGTGGEAHKNTARLLRGRSFQVSLFTEVAVVRILETLGLPPTSVVINTAGRFLLVAPNTEDCLTALQQSKAEIDAWFLEHTFGQAGLGLAWESASCSDFSQTREENAEAAPFSLLMRRLALSLQRAKLQRFDIVGGGAKVFSPSYPLGTCIYNEWMPADRPESRAAERSCGLSRDQLAVSDFLLRYDRLLVFKDDPAEPLSCLNMRRLELRLFGYSLAFVTVRNSGPLRARQRMHVRQRKLRKSSRKQEDEESNDGFGTTVFGSALRRCWDCSVSLPGSSAEEVTLWNGDARRFLGGYVPYRSDQPPVTDNATEPNHELLNSRYWKSFGHILGEECEFRPDGIRHAVRALGMMKGDVDDLGRLLRQGVQRTNLAKLSAVSRQLSAFFCIYLPWLLATEFNNIYTCFTGGDDFLMIGAWRTIQRLGLRMRNEFTRYVAGNPAIHFSAGIAIEGHPLGANVRSLVPFSIQALANAKRTSFKNAITCFGETITWSDWHKIEDGLTSLNRVRIDTNFSKEFIYVLLQLVEMRTQEVPSGVEPPIWYSQLTHHTRRLVETLEGHSEEDRERCHAQIVHDIGISGIKDLGRAYRIVLFTHLFQYGEVWLVELEGLSSFSAPGPHRENSGSIGMITA